MTRPGRPTPLHSTRGDEDQTVPTHAAAEGRAQIVRRGDSDVAGDADGHLGRLRFPTRAAAIAPVPSPRVSSLNRAIDGPWSLQTARHRQTYIAEQATMATMTSSGIEAYRRV